MSSVSIIVIEKGGNIKELKVKSFDETELYKKGGFKSPTDFKQHNVWNQITLNNSTYNIHVYGKTVGRANQENKYEFPPPIDKTLFFGSCILVNKINNVPHNLTSKEWKSIYNQLYGGFEELSGDDSADESIDPDENLPKTKSGYMKDDFIVDDDFEEEDDEDDEEGSLTDMPKNKRTNKKANTDPPKTPGRSKAPIAFSTSDTEDDIVYTNDMELEEEEYL